MNLLTATADADALVQRIGELIDAGRIGAARPLLAAARQLTQPTPGLAELAARLAFQDGSLERAREELDAAISLAPEHAGLRKCRAGVRQRLNDVDGATRDAAEAVILDPHDPSAKAMLGAMMLQLGRTAEAVACLQEAVASAPGEPAFYQALAAAQESDGNGDAAMATLLAGIAAAPQVIGLVNAAIMLCVRRRDYSRAVHLAETARIAGIADACLFGLKGHALSSLGRHDDAADAYHEALKLGPNDPYVRHLVAASGSLPGARRAPREFLQALYDGYADRFESQLISLGYRIPGVIRGILQRHPRVAAGERLGPALDLGCGTGLMGLAISDLPIGPLTGIDVSPRMLAWAQVKQVYAELREGDLMEALAQDETRWPLILAADVMIYFGALEELLAAVHARLTPGGWFVFSVEELVPDIDGTVQGDGRWALLRQGRYAHAADYVRDAALAAGYRVAELRQEVVRHEAGGAVPGVLAVLERTRYDG